MRMRWSLLVLAIGLIASAVAVPRAVTRGPFERSAAGAEALYWDAARALDRGEAAPALVRAFPSPLYVRLLAPFTGDQVNAIRGARRTLGAVLLPICGLVVFALARRRARPGMAVAAALLVPWTAPIALAAGTFSPALPAAILLLLGILALDGSRTPAAWVVAGALVGLSGHLLPAPAWGAGVLLLAAAWWRPRQGAGRRGRWTSSLLFLAAWLAGSAIGGAVAGGGSWLPPLHGVDVYRGHRAEASGVDPRRGDADERRWWLLRDFAREASRLEERRLTSSEAGAFWARRGAAEAIRNPLGELKRTGVKILAAYQGDPAARDVSPAFVVQRGDSGALAGSIWLGRLLVPAGLAGLWVARRRAGLALGMAAVTGLAAAMITFADGESRLPAVLALLAGVALLLETLAAGPPRVRLRAAGWTAVALAVWGAWPALGGVPGQRPRGDDHFQLGTVYDREKQGSAAMREYERALRLEPDNPYPTLAVAGMLARDNVMEEATRELEALRERHPAFVPGLASLARLYERQSRWPEAAAVYGRLVELDPFNPEVLNNLATMYVQTGFFEQAQQALEMALSIDPTYETARANLTALREQGLASAAEGADPLRAAQENVLALMRAGDAAAADSALQAAYARFGRTLDLVFIEGTLRLTTGAPEQAIPLFESLRDSLGTNVIFLNNLAASYARVGRLPEAAATWEQALAVQPGNERVRRSLEQVRATLDSLTPVPNR